MKEKNIRTCIVVALSHINSAEFAAAELTLRDLLTALDKLSGLEKQLVHDLRCPGFTHEEKAAHTRRTACTLLRLANALAPIPGKHFDPLRCATCGEDRHENS